MKIKLHGYEIKHKNELKMFNLSLFHIYIQTIFNEYDDIQPFLLKKKKSCKLGTFQQHICITQSFQQKV